MFFGTSSPVLNFVRSPGSESGYLATGTDSLAQNPTLTRCVCQFEYTFIYYFRCVSCVFFFAPLPCITNYTVAFHCRLHETCRFFTLYDESIDVVLFFFSLSARSLFLSFIYLLKVWLQQQHHNPPGSTINISVKHMKSNRRAFGIRGSRFIVFEN